MLKKFIFLLIIFNLLARISYAQNCFSQYTQTSNNSWYVSAGIGIQISGIKSEDFISSNVAPSIGLALGKWINPQIGLQLGYKGPYFYTISDKDKHHYSFTYGEVLLNLHNSFTKHRTNRSKWNAIMHTGAGYFYNGYYDEPNICGIIGLANTYKISSHFDIVMDVSAIMGWDIYQGDEDILPSLNLGLIYSFHK